MALPFGDLDFSAVEVMVERMRLESLGVKTIYNRTFDEVSGHSFVGEGGKLYPVFVCSGAPTDPTKPLFAVLDNNYECVHAAMAYAQSKLGSAYNVCGFVVGWGIEVGTLADCIVKAGVTVLLADAVQFVHDDCKPCNEIVDLARLLRKMGINAIVGQTYVQADACSLAFRTEIDRLSLHGVPQG